MKDTTKITTPTTYRGYIIVPRNDGFDVVDPATNRWAHFETQRYAKWRCTFLTNLSERFQANPPLPARKAERITKQAAVSAMAKIDASLDALAKRRLKRAHTAKPVDIDNV